MRLENSVLEWDAEIDKAVTKPTVEGGLGCDDRFAKFKDGVGIF